MRSRAAPLRGSLEGGTARRRRAVVYTPSKVRYAVSAFQLLFFGRAVLSSDERHRALRWGP